MIASRERRKAVRQHCRIPAELSFYIPLEYANAFGSGIYPATIVNYNDGGFGILSKGRFSPQMVVCIRPDPVAGDKGPQGSCRSYQSVIKWVADEHIAADGAVSIGVQHIGD